MIAALLLALQSAQLPAPSLTIRADGRVTHVPLVETNTGAALRADLLAVPLGGSVSLQPNGHYAITLVGVALDVTEQVPFARVGTAILPLSGAPFVDGGSLYVPLQLVADILPRLAVGLLYDSRSAELRLVGTAAASGRAGQPGDDAARRTASAPAPRARSSGTGPEARRSRRLVVVDAGHGGPDNGMSGPIGGTRKIYEKDITLAVAARVAAALRSRGVDVLMTRTTDTLIALYDRGRIANQKHGDLFLSIHVNAANLSWKDPAAARGFETYFLAEAKTEDARRVERMENEAVRFETGANAPKGDPLSFIINDMAQNEHLRESSDLAETIQHGLAGIHPGPSRGVKQANFAVLRTSFMPAVLVEIGFGTNAAEASYISDAARQRQLADAIADATVEYLSHYERRVRTSGQ
jgi:N-acetylmuramoyl-L-alanine amidase